MASSSSQTLKRPLANDSVVNTENASKGMWLVKVPRYLSDIWEQNAGGTIGRLVHKGGGETIFYNTISGDTAANSQNKNVQNQQKQSTAAASSQKAGQKSASSSSAVEAQPIGAKGTNTRTDVPSEHKIIIRYDTNQSLAVLCEDKTGLEEETDYRTGKLSIEGRIVVRADCQPPNSRDYMQMKVRQIQKVSQPKKTVQQMDRAVVKFKPVNVHQEHVNKEKAKKEGIRAVRLERDEVIQLLFHAFEKHQFYRQVDLQKITSQPASIIREVLNDIGIYHDSAPHKSMWELKPEYRNYDKELSKKVANKMQQQS